MTPIFFHLLVILILFSFPASTSAAAKTEPFLDLYCIKLVVTTTSSWTKIEPAEGWSENYIITDTILRSGQGGNLVEFSPNSIRQNPYKISKVSVESTIYFKPLKDTLSLNITKADLGKTVVDLYNCNKPIERHIGTLTNDSNVPYDPANTKTFSVSMKKIRRDGPIIFQAEQPRFPKLVLSFYYPWYGSPEGPNKRWRHWNPKKAYASKNTPLLGYYDYQGYKDN